VAAAIDTVNGYGVLLDGVLAFRLSMEGPRVSFETRRLGLGLGLILGSGAIAFALTPSTDDPAFLAVRAVALAVAAAPLAPLYVELRRPRAGGPRADPDRAPAVQAARVTRG
jgi:hypothetical protein